MNRAGLLAVFATAVLAFAVRSLGADLIFVGDAVVFPVGDAYYHLRRALVGMQIFPAVLVWDPLLNFPDGGFVPWPPLHDWLLSSLGKLGGGTVRALEVTAAWLPPVLGALTVVPVYIAGFLLGDWRVGAVSALTFALLPIAVGAGQVGYADHHCTLAAVGAVWLASSLAVTGRGGRFASAVLAVARVAMILLWSGSLLYVAIADGAHMAVETAEDRPRRLARYGLGLCLGALAIAAMVPTLGWTGGGAFTALGLSWLHPLTLGAIGVSALVAAAFQYRWPWPAPLGLARAAAVGMAAAAAVLLLLPELHAALIEALGFVGKQEPWAARNAEQLSLLGPTSSAGWVRPFAFYGPLGYVLPLLPFAAWWCGRRRADLRAPARLLALWIAGFGTLAIVQVRYGGDFAAPASVGAAILAREVLRAVARRGSDRALRGAAAALALIGLGPLVANPVATWASAGSTTVGRDPMLATPAGSLHLFAQSVRDLTPETISFDDPSQRADYAVLCPPNIGHVLHYVGQRATTADNFGPYSGSRLFEDVTRFYGPMTNAAAYSFAEHMGARYVVTMEFGEAQAGSLLERLHQQDGLAVGEAKPWSHFRLIHEGPQGGTPLSALFSRKRTGVAPYKLYEVVPGAVLEANALPGTQVMASATVRTSGGRRFEYRAEGLANARGIARVRVPYPTDGTAPTRTVGEYRVHIGSETLRVTVPEIAVRAGTRVPVAE